ncbi:MAG TPA: energy transducer TonB [Verrucomicrobiae bacterium]|nr:energy transducer TonB [Verrucomicrobiae bacterium]
MRPPKALRFVLLMFCLPLVACNKVEAQQPTVVAKPSAPPPADLITALAAQVKNNAEQIDCKPEKCKILVTTFLFSGKGITAFAVHLSDALAAQLSRDPNPYPVADRGRLQDLIHEERLAPEGQESVDIARWLGRKLNAQAVLTAELSVASYNSIELSAHLLSTGDSKKRALSIKGNFHVDVSKIDLTRSDDSLPPFPKTFAGQPLYRAGPGMFPQCHYAPNPPYTQEAREDHIAGIVIVEAIVGVDGRLSNLRIVRGLPGGLDTQALETLATWRCDPAKFEGNPVAVLASFEVNFKLFK